MIIEKTMKTFSLISLTVVLYLVYVIFTYTDTIDPLDKEKNIFTIKGETEILEKLKINVLYLNRDNSEKIYTIFRNNETFKNNLGRLYYTFYISYDNNQYGTFGIDSIRHAFGIEGDMISINFFQEDENIYYCYQRLTNKKENCREDKKLLHTLVEVSSNYRLFRPYGREEVSQ